MIGVSNRTTELTSTISLSPTESRHLWSAWTPVWSAWIRTFDVANASGGRHPMDVPIVVVTHRIPEEWVNRKGSPFTFVTEGVPRAIEKAREIAGDKDVVVGAPGVTKQCLRLGLLDEIHIDLVPVVLGGGIRLFEDDPASIQLEITAASGTPR
jgi:dihydrofolate reductase